jgi:hypothetical protein
MDGVKLLQEMTHQERHILLYVLVQGLDRQRAPVCCSGGTSIAGASESRCSHDGPADACQQRLQRL